ncbi:MAG TPA: hypothetical protein VG714_02535 [Acidobacteriaceae bacterium]|nr:hypothetical protein [Acidobacteriaceae bacterium]
MALGVLVAPVEVQRERVQAHAARWIRERRFAFALVSALTGLAIAIEGYHPYAEDGGLYLAGVKRLLDGGLYPRDTAFVMEPARRSLFAWMVAGLVRVSHVGLPAMLLALHVASIWATLATAWMLAARCYRGRLARAGAVALLACWMGLPVAGTALFLMDPYLTTRSFATPAMLLALAGALDATERDGAERFRRRGVAMWAAGVAVCAAMHPLMGMYVVFATMVLACLRARSRASRTWGPVVLCAVAMSAAAFAQRTAKPESGEYVRAALTRSYWFPGDWQWYELVGLAAPLVILSALAWMRREDRPASMKQSDAVRTLAQMAVIAGAAAWVVAAIFARESAAPFGLARLQPLRMFQEVYFILVMVLGAWMGERVLQRSAWRWVMALTLLGCMMFAAAREPYTHSRHIEASWSAPRNEWAQAFEWTRDNTPRDALFALDADYIHTPGEDAQSFRAIAERSSLPDYSKDGGEVSLAPQLAPVWVRAQAAEQGLSRASDAERIERLQPLGVTWVVLEGGARTAFDCPYRNAAAKVCRLP